MSRRNLGGFIRPGYNPLRVPNAPTIGTATDSKTDGSVSVAFTAPSCIGGGAITGYTAVANCGSKFASGSSSPITVTGLTNCTAYTFKVYANNAFGPSAYSASSNSATPTKAVVGQQAYTTPGTYSWVAPSGVTKVSVVAVGGGAAGSATTYGNGGSGGGLGYKNNYSVTPGSSYTVVVGAGGCGSTQPGKDSYFVSCSVVKGGGASFGSGGTYTGDGGGNGGAASGGAGGAGGYSGTGGNGNGAANGSAGSGGGGGGGANAQNCCYGYAGAGGGVGILGQGTSGAGGTGGGYPVFGTAGGGKGGSGGADGGNSTASPPAGVGGSYGGGGGAAPSFSGKGGGGAVRIIWPGCSRKFPSTCTGDK